MTGWLAGYDRLARWLRQAGSLAMTGWLAGYDRLARWLCQAGSREHIGYFVFVKSSDKPL